MNYHTICEVLDRPEALYGGQKRSRGTELDMANEVSNFALDDPCGRSDLPSPPNALLGFILQEDGQCGQQLKTSPMILVIANMGIELLYQGRPGLHARAIRTTSSMPQAIAAMSTKFLMPKILQGVGFRGVLIGTRSS